MLNGGQVVSVLKKIAVQWNQQKGSFEMPFSDRSIANEIKAKSKEQVAGDDASALEMTTLSRRPA